MIMINAKAQPLQDRWKKCGENNLEIYKDKLTACVQKVKRNIDIIGEASPGECIIDGQYKLIENNVWTTGFYPGMLWLAYTVTGDECFLKAGKKQTESFRNRYKTDCEMDNHDIGFCYSLSAVADYIMTGDENARELAIDAAYKMSELYMHKAGVINRGGGYSTKDAETEIFIIDCMNNIPLLFWASKVTGDKALYEMAYNHAKNSTELLILPCGAACHVGIAEIKSGRLHRDMERSQGKGGSDAIWSRAQAWAVAGLPIAYGYTKDERFLEAAKKAANFFLNNMPEDMVAPWDLYYTDNETQKDTSASAIAVCGLLELIQYVNEEEAEIYLGAANKIIKALIDGYMVDSDEDNMGILTGATCNFRANRGVNVPNVYGDYYFMEALCRLTRQYERFW